VVEPQKPPFPWPKNSWTILTKIVRAWYTAEESSGEATQKKIASIAGVQQSQVSTNKAFLQAIGIIDSNGGSLTDQGKRVGIGLSNDNASTIQQGLQQIVKDNGLLRDLLDIIKGRGSLKVKDFNDEICLRTPGGKAAPGFATGASILQEIFINAGLIELVGDALCPLKGRNEEAKPEWERNGKPNFEKPLSPGLKRIPIPVSTSSVWWVEVGENPVDGEVEKFLEMQKLMFGTK
jgi:hypothetical protein